MAARKALSKKTRFEVFKRDGFKCMYCGAHPPAVLLEADHINPVAKGGGNDMDNLVTACEACNRGKAARELSSVPQGLADKATSIADREEQLRGYHEVMEAKRERLDKQSWLVMNTLREEQDSAPKDWMNSMRMFIEKLGYFEVLEASDLALGKRPGRGANEAYRWRYFCGICWNKIRRPGEGANA